MDRNVIIFIVLLVVIGVGINFFNMDPTIRKIIIGVVALCALLFIITKFLPAQEDKMPDEVVTPKQDKAI